MKGGSGMGGEGESKVSLDKVNGSKVLSAIIMNTQHVCPTREDLEV